MNSSTIITVFFGLVIGAVGGVVCFSGVIDFAAIGVADGESSSTVEGASEEQTSTSTASKSEHPKGDAPESDAKSAGRELIAKTAAYLEKNPRDRKGALKFGGLLAEHGEFDRAEKFYKSWLSTHPQDSDFLFGLGWTYEQSKQWSKAIGTYEQALSADSNHIASMNNLAWVLSTSPDENYRDGRRAVKLAKEAMRRAGSKAHFVADTLAAACAEFGDFKTAIELQEWLIKKAPQDEQEEVRGRLELYKNKQPYRLQ